jgi:hypothetical protein
MADKQPQDAPVIQFSMKASSPTHALTTNPLIGQVGWHTDFSVRSSKNA